MIGLAAVSLTACARPTLVHDPVEVQVVRYEPVPVPEALLKACKVTLGALNSNQDLEAALADALIELKNCTADKEAIRALE
jgi:hypothetical protein